MKTFTLIIFLLIGFAETQAQQLVEIGYLPLFNISTSTNNVNELSRSQVIVIRYVHNRLIVEMNVENLQFYDNAFAVNRVTASKSFPQRGNWYSINYMNIGLGYSSILLKGLKLDNALYVGFAITNRFKQVSGTSTTSYFTANESGTESIEQIKYSMQQRLYYSLHVNKRLSGSIGVVLQTNFSPLVNGDATNEYFWANKTVSIHHQLGVMLSLSYTLK